MGIQISRDPTRLYSLNYLPLSKSTITTWKTWAHFRHSWFGPMASFKMTILTCFYIYFKQLLFFSCKPFLHTYSIIFGGNKSPCLHYDILVRRKTSEGVGLPHMELYFKPLLLMHMVNQHHNTPNKLGMTTEKVILPILP